MLTNSKEGILVSFPKDIEQESIIGSIYLQRLSNEKLDFTEQIKLTGHQQMIPDEKLVSGKWIVKIDWETGQDKYLFKESWFY